MSKNKENFVVYKDAEGQFFADEAEGRSKVELSVKKPDFKQKQEADIFYAKKWKEYLDAGCILSDELNEVLKKRGAWNEAIATQVNEIAVKIAENEDKLKKGKIKLSEAEKISVENIRLRYQWMQLLGTRHELEQKTAESMANEQKLNWLVAHCTVYSSDGKPFFKSYEDYCEQDDKGVIIPTLAGQAYWKLQTDEESDFRKEWPEYRFLLKYKMVDDKLRPINKAGNLIDEFGREITAEGTLKEPAAAEEIAKPGSIEEAEFEDDRS